MQLALYQPDIPQNTGTLLRLGACLNVPVHIIEPCGFVLNDKQMRRAGMDYLDLAQMTRHTSFDSFYAQKGESRLILLTTKATQSHLNVDYRPDDILLLGRESSGAPEAVHAACDERVRIPMTPETRSLNIAVSAAIVLGEALRSSGGFDGLT